MPLHIQIILFSILFFIVIVLIAIVIRQKKEIANKAPRHVTFGPLSPYNLPGKRFRIKRLFERIWPRLFMNKREYKRHKKVQEGLKKFKKLKVKTRRTEP